MFKIRVSRAVSIMVFCLLIGLQTSCLKDAVEKSQPAGGSVQKLSAGTSNTIQQYYLYLPKDYHNNRNKYPVIVFLHGGTQLQAGDVNTLTNVGVPLHALNSGDFPFIVIAPLLLKTTDRWVIPDLEKMLSEMKGRFRMDESRINLSGFSLGATATWIWASSNPNTFSSINPIGGSTDSNPCNLVRVPVWAFHNRYDTIYSLDNLQNTINAFRACGGNVKLTVYDDGGHEGWTKAYQDPALYEWIGQQRKN